MMVRKCTNLPKVNYEQTLAKIHLTYWIDQVSRSLCKLAFYFYAKKPSSTTDARLENKGKSVLTMFKSHGCITVLATNGH